MSDPTTCADSPNAISSLALECGVTHSETQVGRMPVPCGPEAVPASRSARLESEKAMPTKGTSGRNGSGSLESAALSLCLANRLAQRCRTDGSTLFRMTWKERVTPSGRVIFRLAASGHRTSGKGCTSWPTPVSNDDNKSVDAHLAMKKRMGGNRTAITSLQVLSNASELASWPAPNCDDPNNATRASGQFQSLTRAASWATPSSRDWKDTPGMATTGTDPDGSERMRLDQLPRQANLASGPTPAGTSAPTENTVPYLLNPKFSLWLQGLPVEWAYCGERGILSVPHKRKRS